MTKIYCFLLTSILLFTFLGCSKKQIEMQKYIQVEIFPIQEEHSHGPTLLNSQMVFGFLPTTTLRMDDIRLPFRYQMMKVKHGNTPVIWNCIRPGKTSFRTLQSFRVKMGCCMWFTHSRNTTHTLTTKMILSMHASLKIG